MTYVDISALSVERAKADVLKGRHQDRIQVHLGNGFHPLVDYNRSCDTAIMAGMGTMAVIKILAHKQPTCVKDFYEFESRADTTPRTQKTDPFLKFNLNILDELHISKVIVQPSPPNFLALHALYRLLLSCGWCFDDQGVDEIGKYQYITTSFTRSNPFCVGLQISDQEIFRKSPLFMRCAEGALGRTEMQAWSNYLTTQLITLRRRLQGIYSIPVTSRPSSQYCDLVETMCSEVGFQLDIIRTVTHSRSSGSGEGGIMQETVDR